jgi:hypothetical protein
MSLNESLKINFYYATLDAGMVSDIDDRFNAQATETVRQMSAMCLWKPRQPDDVDKIRQFARKYDFDSDLCANEYIILRNHPALNNPDLASLTGLVSHITICTVMDCMKHTM